MIDILFNFIKDNKEIISGIVGTLSVILNIYFSKRIRSDERRFFNEQKLFQILIVPHLSTIMDLPSKIRKKVFEFLENENETELAEQQLYNDLEKEIDETNWLITTKLSPFFTDLSEDLVDSVWVYHDQIVIAISNKANGKELIEIIQDESSKFLKEFLKIIREKSKHELITQQDLLLNQESKFIKAIKKFKNKIPLLRD